jgi:CHAT domain-containing protein
MPIDSLFWQKLHQVTINIASPVSKQDVTEANNFLFQKLILPIEPTLQKITALNIIADDELLQLPFEILQNQEEESLIQKYSINYYSSYSTLFHNNSLQLKDTCNIAVAPFASQSVKQWQQLKQSTKEVEQFKGMILKDEQASKKNILQNIANKKIIHFATHSIVNDSFPMSSAIALYDTVLYAGEIANLDLHQTQLVYLSTCESAAGKLIKGEGIMNLARSFAYAGCPNSITSLWKADDVSTAYITQKFYDNLQKGVGIAAALQKAKLTYLADASIEKRKKTPYYWAHLISIGPVAQSMSNYTLVFVSIGLVLLSILLFYIWKRKQR